MYVRGRVHTHAQYAYTCDAETVPEEGGGHGTQPRASCTVAFASLSSLLSAAMRSEKSAEVLMALEHTENDVGCETKPGAHALPHATQRLRASSWYWPTGHRRQPRFAGVQLAYGIMRCALPPQSHGTRCAAIQAATPPAAATS